MPETTGIIPCAGVQVQRREEKDDKYIGPTY